MGSTLTAVAAASFEGSGVAVSAGEDASTLGVERVMLTVSPSHAITETESNAISTNDRILSFGSDIDVSLIIVLIAESQEFSDCNPTYI